LTYSGPRAFYSYRESCEALGVPPQTFRLLLREFGDLLPGMGGGGDGERRLAADALYLLARAVELRSRGACVTDVRRELESARLERGSAGTQSGTGCDAVQPDGASARLTRLLQAQVDRLNLELQRQEQRHARDRERILLALLRTRQELQYVRNEVACARSRAERKRGGRRRS